MEEFAEAVIAALGDFHEARMGVDELPAHRAGRGLGIEDSAGRTACAVVHLIAEVSTDPIRSLDTKPRAVVARLAGVDTGDAPRTLAGLALAGATGRVTGPHLHWSARIQGARVDPFSLLSIK
jgi:hypothetical protein